MVDVETLRTICEFQNSCDDIDLLNINFETDCEKTMEALGDDETEIVEFIETADTDMLLLLSEVIERISAKFPDSEAIDKVLDKVVDTEV